MLAQCHGAFRSLAGKALKARAAGTAFRNQKQPLPRKIIEKAGIFFINQRKIAVIGNRRCIDAHRLRLRCKAFKKLRVFGLMPLLRRSDCRKNALLCLRR